MPGFIESVAPGLTRGADGVWYPRSGAADRPEARRPDVPGSPARGAVHYPDQANAFCFAVEEHSFWFRYRNAFILAVVRRFPPPGWIADIGAGNGFVGRALEQAGFPTITIEPGPVGARNARSRGLDPVICATLEDAGFEDGSIPAAGLFDVVEHIVDDRAFFEQLHQKLAPGGRLYLTVPALSVLWSSEDDFVGHHHRYTLRMLMSRLQSAGFSVDYATYVFAALTLPVFLLRALPWRVGLRPTLDPQRTGEELQPKEGVLVRAVSRTLDWELSRVTRGRTVPIGTSCLVTARKGPAAR